MTYTNALKKIGLLILTCITFNLALAQVAVAAEDTAAAPASTETTTESTTAETEKTNDNIGANEQTRISRLAELSGKTKEEILKMRTEQKMGWGAIAKALGVPPKELGQAIRDDRKEGKAQRKLEKNERKEKKSAMKEKRQNQKELKEQKSENKEKK